MKNKMNKNIAAAHTYITSKKPKGFLLKENLKWIIIIIICCTLCSGLTVYGAYNYFSDKVIYTKQDGTKTDVKTALDELYNKNNETDFFSYIPKMEKVWSSGRVSSVNYSYTFEESGTYLIVSLTSGPNSLSVSSKDVILEISPNSAEIIKIVNAEKGDTVNISSRNGGGCAINAFIVKFENIKLKGTYQIKNAGDGTATISYTAQENEKKIVMALQEGNSRSASITYQGKNILSQYRNDTDYIDYCWLQKGCTVTASSYGYVWGRSEVIILDCQ